MSSVALPYAVFYQTVAPSQTAQVLGVTGAKGDIVTNGASVFATGVFA